MPSPFLFAPAPRARRRAHTAALAAARATVVIGLAVFISVGTASADPTPEAAIPVGATVVVIPAPTPAPEAEAAQPAAVPVGPAPAAEPMAAAVPEPSPEPAPAQALVPTKAAPARSVAAAEPTLTTAPTAKVLAFTTAAVSVNCSPAKDYQYPTAPTAAACVLRPDEPTTVQHVPITLCHADNGVGNGYYVEVTVDDDAVDKNGGHDGHDYDVIPAFTYATGHVYDQASNTWVATTAHYSGKNLGAFTRVLPNGTSLNLNGATVRANGCSITTPAPVLCPAGSTTPTAPTLAQCGPIKPAQPVVQHLPITLCHADNGNGDDFYTVVTVDDDSVTKNAGHDGHAFDVIPAFTYATGSTYNAATNTWTVATAHYDGKNLGDFTRAVHFPVIGTVTLTLNGATMLTNGCTLTPPAPVVVNCPAGSTTPTAPTLAQCVPIAPQPVVQHLPITLCHADTGNGNDFYTLVTVDDDSVTKNGAGHDGHAFDVIPAFTYATGSTYNAATNTWTVTTAHYDGKNLGDFTRVVHFPIIGTVTLTLNGATMLTNGCTLTPPAPVIVDCPAGSTTPTAPTLAQCVPVAPQPVVQHLPITLCHADNGNGDDFYTVVTVDDDSITKNAGHDGHAFDVIPAFTYATGSTYNAATNTWTVTTAHYDGKNLGDFTRAVHFPIIGTVTLTLNGATMLTNGCTLTPPAPVVVNCPAGSTTPTAPTLAQCVPVAPQPVVQHLPIMLCHADNGNGDDFYTLVSVDDDSITKNAGHDGHAFDVIPAFTYATGSTYDAATNTWTVTTAHYDGKNLGDFTRTVHFPKLGNVTLTLNGANMLTNGCTLTPPAPVVVNCPAGSTTPTAPTLAQCVPVAPQPVVQHLPITLCHADNGNGDDFYTVVTVDDDSVTKNAGHDGHAFDVIPAFTYATGSTYNAATHTWTVTTAHYDGKNLGDFTRAVHFPIIGTGTLTLNGATMLTSGCALAAPGPVDCPAGSTTPTAPTLALCGPIKPAQPVVQHLPITVCHAGISNGDDTYALVSADDETIPTADGHGGHAFDVIPAFTYTTGFTYDAGANAWIATTATYAGKNLGDFTRVMHFAAVGNAAVTLNGANMLANGCALTPPDAPAVVTDLCVNLPGTQAVVPAGLALLAGACVAPAVVVPPVAPTNVDVPVAPTVPQAPTVEPDPIEASGGPSGADADPIDAVDTTTPPVKAVDPDEAKVVAARADDPSDHSLPFTGLSLSLLLALGFGGVLLGSSLHTGARNRRRERTSDRDA